MLRWLKLHHHHSLASIISIFSWRFFLTWMTFLLCRCYKSNLGMLFVSWIGSSDPLMLYFQSGSQTPRLDDPVLLIGVPCCSTSQGHSEGVCWPLEGSGSDFWYRRIPGNLALQLTAHEALMNQQSNRPGSFWRDWTKEYWLPHSLTIETFSFHSMIQKKSHSLKPSPVPPYVMTNNK